MNHVVEVPLNTMLADLDESLRELLRRELERHGFDGVEIAFDAPSREWSGQLTQPTVNLFLYDIRESPDFQLNDWETRRGNDGRSASRRPPLMLDASYSITAWTQAVEDEHRLLSQALGVLFSYPQIPDDVLKGRLANGSQHYPLEGRVGQPKAEGKADFWTAVGGQYKASLDYVVSLACESGTVLERGPEVRTTTVAAGLMEAGRGQVAELHRLGGTVTDADGAPAAGAWVVMPDTGRWTATDGRGRFNFAPVASGKHRCLARGADGAEASANAQVPGQGVDLVLAPPKPARAKKGR